MDRPDRSTIQHIQRIIDDTIRERNETRQANKNIKKKEEQMRIHLDNLYDNCKAQNAKLLQYEETNNKIAIEILNLKRTVRQQMVTLGQKNNEIKQFGNVEDECEEILNETTKQKDTLKQVQLENVKIKDWIDSCEFSKRKLCEKNVSKVKAMKSEIKTLKEEDKSLKKELQSLCDDEVNINKMYNRVKQDFEHTCNTLGCLEKSIAKHKENERGLELEMKDLLVLKEKLTTRKLNDSFKKEFADIMVDENCTGDKEIRENKNTQVVDKSTPTDEKDCLSGQDRKEIIPTENKVHFEDSQCSSSKHCAVSMCVMPVRRRGDAMGNSSSSSREPRPPAHWWTLSYPRLLPDRFPGQRLRVTTLHRHAYGAYSVPVTRFGSEPDLRCTGREFVTPTHHTSESPSKQRLSRSRKKYKAPTPLTNGVDSSSPESYQPWDTSADNSEVQAPPLRKSRLFKTHAQSKGPGPPRLSKVPPLYRSLSSPQFHEELLEATQKWRHQLRHRSKSPSALDNHVNSNHGNQMSDNHPNHTTDSTKTIQAPPRQNRSAKENQITPNIRAEPQQYLYNESSDKENLPSSANENKSGGEMREIVMKDDVRSHWDNIKPVKTFYFGMQEDDLNNNNNNGEEMDRFAASIQRHSPVSDTMEVEHLHDISLHLRPTLPRKQLDIPRFSPAAAWRLLSCPESPPPSCLGEDELVVPRLTDKSIDSGISGDASPRLLDSQAAWTPQQDLEETSSDGGLESSPVTPDTARVPTFSLSLPRDVNNATHSFTMLQPSGWLTDQGGSGSLVDENWVLSRSVPSSLHLPPAHTSLPYSGARVMYLPEYQPSRVPHALEAMSPLSKSCDSLVMSHSTAALLTDPTPKKSKRFTFQSTVRQIERRRLAEKLSKQAEHKERQRLMELETMQRVEAEFQRKREREKADIRQQLRLYTHVLSEYKQPSRDYKDYTPNITRSEAPAPDPSPSQVVHPQVIYQMPKNTQVYVVANGVLTNSASTLSDSSNYRKDFAQGVMPRSGSEVSQPISHRSSLQVDLSQDISNKEASGQAAQSEIAPTPPEPKRPSLVPASPPPPVDSPKCLKPSPVLTSLLQPFDRNKAYRPIAFNPNPPGTQIAGQ